MSTWRFKLLVTNLSTGMWEDPRVRLRVHLLPTVTVITSGSLLRGILMSALRTRERESLIILWMLSNKTYCIHNHHMPQIYPACSGQCVLGLFLTRARGDLFFQNPHQLLRRRGR